MTGRTARRGLGVLWAFGRQIAGCASWLNLRHTRDRLFGLRMDIGYGYRESGRRTTGSRQGFDRNSDRTTHRTTGSRQGFDRNSDSAWGGDGAGAGDSARVGGAVNDGIGQQQRFPKRL